MRGRLVAVLLVLLAAPPAAQALKVEGPVRPGGLLMVTAPPGARLLMANGAAIAPAPDGRFLVPLCRDCAGPLALEAVGPNGVLARHALTVPERSYRVQNLPGLGTRDDPPKEWLDRRAREVARINAAKAEAAARPGEAQGFMQAFRRPASGRISGVYGSQRVFGGLPRNPHWGLDIAAPTGTPVVAPADGIVRLAAGPFLLEGNIVILDHGAGLVTNHVHLDSMAVRAGQAVKAGERIGTIGTTGRSTGPHLHWGASVVRQTQDGLDEVRIDPALLAPAG